MRGTVITKTATWTSLAGAAAVLSPTAAWAGIIVTNVNTGFTNSYTGSIGGNALSISQQYYSGPLDLYYYDQQYGFSGSDAGYYGYNLNIAGSPNLQFSPGSLQPSGLLVGPGLFGQSETVVTNQYNGSTYGGSRQVFAGYGSCGKNCQYPIYNTYFYQYVSYSGPYSSGIWLDSPTNPGFIGLELNNGGQTNYGWLEFSLDNTGGSDLLVDFIAYGLETNPNQPIATGATTDSVAVPEPASLSLFAAGGLGLAALRRRRKKSAA